MALKYPNKKKRAGYWKQYEKAGIKDYRKVWNFCIELVDEKYIPFQFNYLGRKPNLNRKEYVCMSILHAYFDLDFRETELIKEMMKKGIKLYYLCYGNTSLDKLTVKMYNDIGISCKLLNKPKDFINGHNLGVYGDLVVQTTHPVKIAQKIEEFFKKCKKIEEAKLSDITDIVTEETEIKLTVIKDPLVASKIRNEIINKIKYF